jgi:hypothetical protein
MQVEDIWQIQRLPEKLHPAVNNSTLLEIHLWENGKQEFGIWYS